MKKQHYRLHGSPIPARRKKYVKPLVASRLIAAMVAGNVGSQQDPGGGRNPTRAE